MAHIKEKTRAFAHAFPLLTAKAGASTKGAPSLIPAAHPFLLALEIGLPARATADRFQHIRSHHFPDVRGEVALERAQRRIAHAKLLLELVHRLAFPADFKWGSALKDYGSTPVREVIGEAVPPLFTRLHGSVLVEILKNQAGPVVPITLSDKRCGNAREKLDMPLPTLGPRKIGSHVIVI